MDDGLRDEFENNRLIMNCSVETPSRFSIMEILDHLIKATDILLHTHNYDGHGHELLYYAVEAAKTVKFKKDST